jgi:hypothetical protein
MIEAADTSGRLGGETADTTRSTQGRAGHCHITDKPATGRSMFHVISLSLPYQGIVLALLLLRIPRFPDGNVKAEQIALAAFQTIGELM